MTTTSSPSTADLTPLGPEPDPRVSIMTAVRNNAPQLPYALESVANQGYPNLQYVLIDGASTDGTMDVVDRYRDLFDVVVSEPDTGVYDAWNKGLSRCDGDLVKILNSDDELTDGSIRTAVDAYRQHGDNTVLASPIEVIDSSGEVLKLMTPDQRRPNPGGPLLHPSWYVPAEVYRRHGLYDAGFRFSADYELFLRLQREGVEFVYLPTCLARFRTGGLTGSAFAGLGESYRITAEYFGVPAGFAMVTKLAALKVRSAVARRVIGETAFYRLRASIRERQQ